MAKFCPETNTYVLYLECLECETKSCKNNTIIEKTNIVKEEEKFSKNTLPNGNNMI